MNFWWYGLKHWEAEGASAAVVPGEEEPKEPLQ